MFKASPSHGIQEPSAQPMNQIAMMLLVPILLVAAAAPAGVAAPAQPTPGKFNPVSIDKNKTRIFMPLRNAKVTKKQSRVTSWSLEATSDTPGAYTLERAVQLGALHHLRIQNFENKTYIKADWRYAAPVEVKVRSGGLEIVIHHKKSAPYFRTVAHGVKFWEGQRWSAGGPMRVRALLLDPKWVELEPAPASAGTKNMGLAKVSNLARWHGAIAAVNGSFYSPATGEPQGTLVLDRQLISRTMLDRPSVWFEKDGDVDIRVEKPIPTVLLDDGTGIRCQAVNEQARHNRVTLYTGHYGKRTRTKADPSRWEIAVNAAGRVVGEGAGDLQIPKGGYVLSGQGSGSQTLKKYIGYGQELRLEHNLPGDVRHAMGGGPTLIQNGKVRVLAKQQHFRPDVANGRAPRTAFGTTADGRQLLVTIDGRRPGYSVGATLTELAWAMREMGAIEALNLDGGGSTTMWLRGRTLGVPSDGKERWVSTALLVKPRSKVASASPLALEHMFSTLLGE